MTGPGEIEPTRMPCLKTWRESVYSDLFSTKRRCGYLVDSNVEPSTKRLLFSYFFWVEHFIIYMFTNTCVTGR
jgi:hypothetical protein